MLTDRQRRFVDAYVADPNGKRAAIKAGYSEKGSEVTASRLLRHPKVAAELARRRQAVAAAAGVSPEMVIAELAKLGFSDIRKVVNWCSGVARMTEDADGEPHLEVTNEVRLVDSASLDDQTAAAVAEVSQSKDGTLRVKMHDKLGALVKIGQHLGMFRPITTPEEPGKKEQRAAEARTADQGTVWEGLIN